MRGTVLMNSGIAPGLTNLLVADMLARHPEADEVELVFTVSVKGSAGPAGGHPDRLTATKRHRTTVVPAGAVRAAALPRHRRTAQRLAGSDRGRQNSAGEVR